AQPGRPACSPAGPWRGSGAPRPWPRRLKHAVEETEAEVAPHRVGDARQRSGGVEKYSSIASRQAPEHGSTLSSSLPDSRISAAIFSAQLMQTPARSIPQPVQLQLDA